MENEHFLNILKIISNDDYDEYIAVKIYNYLESRKILKIDENYTFDVSADELAEIESLLANTHITKRAVDSISPYEYFVVQQDTSSR